MPNLLTLANKKILKGEELGWRTAILNFAPGKLSGFEVCPKRNKECYANCLYHSGHGFMPTVKEARLWRTRLFFEDRNNFLRRLHAEITLIKAKAKEDGRQLAIRLNGTSDIAWERVRVDHLFNDPQGRYGSGWLNMMDIFPEVEFYDYTKIPIPKRKPWDSGRPLHNYHLTYSWSGFNKKACTDHLRLGYNVAVPYHGDMPEEWRGFKTIDGDASDLRFLDPSRSVVMLKAKGKLRHSNSPFAIGERK